MWRAKVIEVEGVTVMMMDANVRAALLHLLNVTVGVGEIPVNSALTRAELACCLSLRNDLIPT